MVSTGSVRTVLSHIASSPSTPDHITVQREALDAIRQVVPFDVGSFATVDPATVLWTSCAVYGLDRSDGQEAFMFENEYLQDDVLKISGLAREPRPAGRISALDPEARERSMRYQMLRGNGAVDELRCALVEQGTCWGSFEIYRAAQSGPFSDEDTRNAALLAEPLARLVRLALLRQAAALPASIDEPPGVMLLGPEGDIEAMSPACQGWIDEIDAASSVPPAVRSLALGLTARDEDVMTVVTPRASGGWLRLHATRLVSDGGEKVNIVIEPVKQAVLPETVARVYGFTPREGEVITWMARGLSSKEIAARLGISTHTVNDHAKSVFQKAGVQSRQQLIATLFFDHCLPLRQREAIPGPYGWFLSQD